MAYFNNVIVDWPKRSKEHNIHGHKYIYYVVESRKVDKLKYPKQKRIAIGKPVEGEKRKMYPNDSYFKFFPNEISKLRIPCKNHFSDTIKIGTVKALQTIAENTGLTELLHNLIGVTYSDFILDFASYSIINESTVAQHFPNFMRDHAVLSKGKIDDTTVSEYFLNAINNAQIHEFFRDWIKKCGLKGTVCISYDSTNINTMAGVDIEEFGNAKDDKTKPIINISYVFDQDNGTPLFYELYNGSINDMSECKRMIEKAKKYDLNEAVFVLDRGYFGKENMQNICQICNGYIAMARHGIKSVQYAIDEVRSKILFAKHFIKEYGIHGIRTEGYLFPDVKNYFYVYYTYNDRDVKEAFFQGLAEDQVWLNEKIGKILSNEDIKKYGSYFELEIDENNRLLSFEDNESAQEKAIMDTGFFVIASNLKKEPKEIYDIYRKRDAIEKLFRNKTYTGLDDLGVHSKVSLCSKVFVCFITSILRSYILKHTEGLRLDSRKYYTVPACIRELEKIEASRFLDKQHTILYSLTKRQKDILNALNVPVECMDNIRFYE